MSKDDTLQIDEEQVHTLTDKALARLTFIDARLLERHPHQPRIELDIPKIVADFCKEGRYLDQYPIIAFANGKVEREKVGGRTVLRPKKPIHIGQGHRRHGGILHILSMSTDEKTADTKAGNSQWTWRELAARVAPDGLVPVDLRTDIDTYDQIKVVNDHGKMKSERPLSLYEELENVGRFVREGKYTESQIVDLVGLGSRETIRQYKRFAVMPREVKDQFKSGKLKRGALAKLYKAGADDSGGRYGGFVASGPLFKATLESEQSKASGKGDPNHMTATEVIDHMKVLVAECAVLQEVFAALFDGKTQVDKAVAAAQKLDKVLAGKK